MASSALNQLIEGDWGDTEIILVDLPPGTGDVQLSLVQKSRPAGAVIVSTPQDLSLIDATRAIDLFGKTSVPVLGIIENMAGYQCPHCGETSDPFGQGGAEASASELGVPFLGRLPLSTSLREASDAGTPPAAGDGPAAEAFAEHCPTAAGRAGESRRLKHCQPSKERANAADHGRRHHRIADRASGPSPWSAHPTGPTGQATA